MCVKRNLGDDRVPSPWIGRRLKKPDFQRSMWSFEKSLTIIVFLNVYSGHLQNTEFFRGLLFQHEQHSHEGIFSSEIQATTANRPQQKQYAPPQEKWEPQQSLWYTKDFYIINKQTYLSRSIYAFISSKETFTSMAKRSTMLSSLLFIYAQTQVRHGFVYRT